MSKNKNLLMALFCAGLAVFSIIKVWLAFQNPSILSTKIIWILMSITNLFLSYTYAYSYKKIAQKQ